MRFDIAVQGWEGVAIFLHRENGRQMASFLCLGSMAISQVVICMQIAIKIMKIIQTTIVGIEFIMKLNE